MIGEVVALVDLLPGIATHYEKRLGTVCIQKSHDLISVGHVSTARHYFLFRPTTSPYVGWHPKASTRLQGI